MKNKSSSSKDKSIGASFYRFIRTANLFLVPQLIAGALMILFAYTLYAEPDWNTAILQCTYIGGSALAFMLKLAGALEGF